MLTRFFATDPATSGHQTEIVCVSFSPQSDLIATGSMENTAKLWDVEYGTERGTLYGHSAEIVSLHFNAQVSRRRREIDRDTERGKGAEERADSRPRRAENEIQGNLMVTGSFDHDSRIWDTRTGTCVHRLQGHTGEVSSTQFNYGGDLCVSGSIDR